ncbi:GNAT family N-acetyltransferase [Rahnella bonaserana]|uniref:GNAT family N-acetyltransferase n=1 Tax=Rahnella bonaserana TaxID=2816248 RepID=A0ABS6LNP9_9GAMM|nr:GNAT family N-acetyltransferase [Rahnella bonaserana]MBU9853730.1 GNAT family N-acetyltransferase [Rahnella bonaserana]MCL9642638.1 GNAT family N-acetyltransferase [Rahnella victoriana]WHZ39455.1 GNAT family N-acetyltransferase [Rahnella bonaserana]
MQNSNEEVVISEVQGGVLTPADLDALAETLMQSVALGASIGFILPFGFVQAQAFWQKLLPAFERGEKRLLVARVAGKIAGTVQLVVDQPANGIHRGDVVKLMVHPDGRRKGIARQLMTAVEALAREEGKTLLVLDTVTGSPAQTLYENLGFTLSGTIPHYAMSTQGMLESTSVMYKVLM